MKFESEQHLFDHVVGKLREQGQPARLHGSYCKYRMETDEGTVLACAAGHCLTDEEYASYEAGGVNTLEGETVNHVVGKLREQGRASSVIKNFIDVPEGWKQFPELLNRLQLAHDDLPSSSASTWLMTFMTEAKSIAEDYHLTFKWGEDEV